MSASRGSQSRLNGRGARRITHRDRSIIAVVAQHGAASRDQLMALGLFTSVSRANRRLRLLCDARFLRRTYLATGPNRTETIYVLGQAGSSVAVEESDLDPTEMKRQGQRMPERTYLEHHLLGLSVRLDAERVTGGVRLVEFRSEPECRHEYEVANGARSQRRLIKPDAYALFARDGELLPTFIEVDRGHVSLPQMASMFARYGDYLKDGAFTDAYGYTTGTLFTVAVITTAGRRRIDHLRRIARRKSLPVRFTTYRELQAHGFNAAIWLCPNTEQAGFLWDGSCEASG